MNISSRRMALRGGFLLLSLFLGDIPTILAAAEVFGFVPTKADKGEGTAGINVNPARLFDIAYSIHEKSSKFLKEHRKEPERTTSQPNAEMIAHFNKPAYAYNSTRNNKITDKQSSIGNSSQTLLNNSTGGRGNAYDSQYDSANKANTEFDDYGDRRDKDLISYSQCSEEDGDVSCKYVSDYKISEKNEALAETNTSLTESSVHQHSNYSIVSNADNTVQNGSAAELLSGVGISGNNKTADNGTNILRNITAVFKTTKNPVHERATEATTKLAQASSSIVPEEQVPALKDLIRPRVNYESILESSKTDSHSISDYTNIQTPYTSYIPYQAHHEPIWNSPARNMCVSCGPNGYCDISQDPNVCVCHIGYRGIPPDCYQPSGDEMLRSYSMLLRLNSNKNVSSVNSPLIVNSKDQNTKSVLRENKGSASPKK